MKLNFHVTVDKKPDALVTSACILLEEKIVLIRALCFA